MVDFAAGISYLKWQSVARPVDDVELEDLQLYLLSAALDRLSGLDYFSDDVDDALAGDVRHVGDHLLWGLLRFEGAGLKGVEVLPEYDEAVVALAPDVVNPGSHEDFLSLEGLIDLGNGSPFALGAEGGLDEGVVAKDFFGEVDVFDFLVGFHDAKIKIC